MSIIIFAGHHPARPGASWNGFNEHDEALRWLKLLREFFEEEDLLIGPIGTLKKKTEFINNRSPILCADLHFNSAPLKNGEPQGVGCETLYYPGSEKGKIAAEYVQSSLSVIFKPDRGCKEGYYRMDPTRGADWFLARTKSTALIVEPEFIHCKSTIVDNREAGVEALALGLSAAVNALGY